MKPQEIETDEIETEQITITLTPKAEAVLWQIKNNVFQNDTRQSWARNLLKRLKKSRNYQNDTSILR